LNFNFPSSVLFLTLEETTMGILDRIFGGHAATNEMERVRSTRPDTEGQYIPANQPESTSTSLARHGSAILDRAGRFYKENPRKVQAAGLVAAAMLLTSLGRRR
jgi:hypothetical protein